MKKKKKTSLTNGKWLHNKQRTCCIFIESKIYILKFYPKFKSFEAIMVKIIWNWMNTIAPKNSLLWGLGCELALSTCGDLLLKLALEVMPAFTSKAGIIHLQWFTSKRHRFRYPQPLNVEQSMTLSSLTMNHLSIGPKTINFSLCLLPEALVLPLQSSCFLEPKEKTVVFCTCSR